MEILYLTIFFSVLFAATFIYMFVSQHSRVGKSMEQQSLLPLREDSQLADSSVVESSVKAEKP